MNELFLQHSGEKVRKWFPHVKRKRSYEIVGYQSVPITRTYVGLLCSGYLDYYG